MNKKRETSIELLIRKIQVRVARVLKEKDLLEIFKDSDIFKSVDLTLGSVTLSDHIVSTIRDKAERLCYPDIPRDDIEFHFNGSDFSFKLYVTFELDKKDLDKVVLAWIV